MTLAANELWSGDVIAVRSESFTGPAMVISNDLNDDGVYVLRVQVQDITGAVVLLFCDPSDDFDDASDADMVTWIRAICARELQSLYVERDDTTVNGTDFPFFWASYDAPHNHRDVSREIADAQLLRIFRAERPNHDTDLDAMLVMCHG